MDVGWISAAVGVEEDDAGGDAAWHSLVGEVDTYVDVKPAVGEVGAVQYAVAAEAEPAVHTRAVHEDAVEQVQVVFGDQDHFGHVWLNSYDFQEWLLARMRFVHLRFGYIFRREDLDYAIPAECSC